MGKNIQVIIKEGDEPQPVPLEENDNSLLLSVLQLSFPKAIGLRAENIPIIELTEGKFYPPECGWGNKIYYCVQSEDEEIEIIDESLIKSENDQIGDESDSVIRKLGRTRKPMPSHRKPHRCDICGNCFTQQSHMLRHRRIHTGEKPFACDQCGERFSRSDKLKLHFEKIHCEIPEVTIEIPQGVTLRDRREKKPKVLDDSYEWGQIPPQLPPPVVKSKHLTVRFKKNAKLDLDNGHDGYYHVVDLAETKYDDEPEIVPEIKIVEKKTVEKKTVKKTVEKKTFSCTICSKGFAKKNQLQRHARIHTGERPFNCEACNKSFTRIDALKRHTASMGHQKQEEQLAESEFSAPEEIDNFVDAGSTDRMDIDPLGDNAHPQEFLSEDDDEEMSCNVLSYAQVTMDEIQEEKEEVKESELKINKEDSRNGVKEGKENYCHLCKHVFNNRNNFSKHMKSHERVEKTFRCQYCHYIFRRQSHLTRHVLIHTGEKPFQCNYCEEKFSRSDKLKIHIEKLHS